MSVDQVLLVIDMQLRVFDDKITPAIVNEDRLLSNIAFVISAARGRKIPIVYVQTPTVSGQLYAEAMNG